MADPLEQLSDADLQALSKNDMESMSDEGLKIVAASGPTQEPKAEPWGHWAIRQGLPLAGTIGGGIGGGALAGPIGAVGGSAAGNAAGAEAAGWANHAIYGDKAPTYDSADDLKRIGVNAAVGGTAETGGQLIGKGISAAAKSAYIKPWLDDAGQLVLNGFNKAGAYVGAQGEKLSLKATGATGAQMSKFKPGTGKALVDNVAPKFGESQEAYAGRINDFVDQTGTKIGDIVDDLTKQGATGSKENLVAGIQSKIDELGTDPAQAQVVKQLEGIKSDVAAGPDTPDISQLQKTKQGFQRMVNYANPEGNAAKAAAADVYKNAAIDAGAQTDYRATKSLVDANKTYSQLNDVAVASGRRAATVSQSPMGGFLDTSSAAAGAMAGGPAGAVIAPLARRTLTSRLPTTMAATANSLSQVLTKTPEVFGKWAPALSKAAARGETSLNAADYVLQQRDPGYRQKRQEIDSGPSLGPMTDTED